MMKKYVFLIFVLIFINFISAVDCPIGITNDPYPGSCGLYTDNNKDGYCDYGETDSALTTLSSAELHDLISGQEMKNKTVGEVAEIYGLCKTEYSYSLSQKYGFLISSEDNFSALGNKGVQPSVAKEIAESMILSGKTEANKENVVPQPVKITKEYYFWQMSLILSILYFSSVYLIKYNIFTLSEVRKFWNLALLVTFIITALTSVVYLLNLNYGIVIPTNLNITFWHIEIGLAMILISIFHTIWHVPYFKSYFR